VILSDRGDPLAEPRLDPPAAPEQSFENAAALRPDYNDLWARMRAGFALPQLDSPLVQKHIQYYTYRPEYLERMFERGSRYLFYIVEEIERRGMPGELALLPFVESAMNPTAMSPAKAAGLWQFIPSTGKAYNLSQNWWVDNRRDPVHSTQAALDYLQKIYELQGNDWFLALASYNWGEGAVGRAMRRNQANGRPADYLSLNMPQETRHYVPKLMALREIVANPASFNVRLPALPNKPYFVEVEAPLHLDLKLAARFAGLSEEEFISLNPAHNRPVIAARSNDQIKIPADRVDSFLAAMKAHEDANKPFSRWRPYTLEQGESIQSLASRLGTSTQEIMRANGLRTAKVLPGTRLLAPAPDDKPTAVTVMTSFEGPRILEKVQRPAIYHRVGKRETTDSIARRYGITAASLQAWNNLKHEVKLGMRLLVKPASAQTVLTNESGVSKVIATEVVAPKQPLEGSKDAVKPQDDVVKSKAIAKSGTGNKNPEPPKAKAAKDQKQQLVEPSKAVKTSTQGSTKPLTQTPKPTAQTTTEVGKKAGGGNNPAPEKTAKQKSAPDTKASPDANPKPAPRVTASYPSALNLGLL
jgi:membrane-bound lytic murein transglycosylase D